MIMLLYIGLLTMQSKKCIVLTASDAVFLNGAIKNQLRAKR